MSTDVNTEMPRQRTSLTTRLSLITAAILIVAVLFVGGLALFGQQAQINQALETKATSLALLVAEVSPESIWLRDFNTLETYIHRVVATDAEVIYTVVLGDEDQILATAFALEDSLVAPVAGMLDANVLAAIDAMKQSGRVLEVTAPINGAGETLGKVKLGLSYNQTWQATVVQTLIIGIATLISMGLGILILVVVLRRMLLPVTQLTVAAEQIGAGNLDTKIEAAARSDELGILVWVFNDMANRLNIMVGSLESQVAARTYRLEMLTTLNERLSAILDLDDLLAETVNQLNDNFGYYHSHVYLLDESRENLTVVEGSGQAGAAMKAQGHAISLDAPASLVAQAARTRQAVVVPDVRESADWLANPLLPDTQAELAVPIVLDDQVVGVLDVQADTVGGLDDGDASLLHLMANQIGVAIRNARLFAQVENALALAREAQERYLEQAWQARTGHRPEYNFQRPGTAPIDDQVITRLKQAAIEQDQPVSVPLAEFKTGEMSNSALVAPIRLQGQIIGTMHFVETALSQSRQFTKQELALVQAIADQVAQTAENLRLFDEIQERAGRERLIGQVSDRLRRAPDLDSLMQTAVGELSRILGPDRAFVRLGSESELGAAANGGPGNGGVPESDPETETNIDADSVEPADETPVQANGRESHVEQMSDDDDHRR